MKKLFIICICVFGCLNISSAQNDIAQLLSSIEQNNTTLKSLRQVADANKYENRTDIYLPDPEVGFNYLWGSPASIGNRYDISVKQQFDIPTISGVKFNVAKQKNEMIEWQYKADRMKILLDAKQCCLDIIYYNAILREFSQRLEYATKIADVQKQRLESGDVNILEYNNAQLNLSNVSSEICKIETERDVLLLKLNQLNGGNKIDFTKYEYDQLILPSDFNQWYDEAEIKNPILQYVKQSIELEKKQVTLSKLQYLPVFSAGYMNETIVGEVYQGVSVEMTIPLWSNANKIKQAKSALLASESKQIDEKQQFLSSLEIQYTRVVGLKKAADKYRLSLGNANNSLLLKKALDAGQISLLNYILEVTVYYDTVIKALEAERDFQKSYAELTAVEL